ncbi:MAG: hypothetical protein ACYC40_02875, partial [Patescibacteria group bacterium]
FFYAEKEGFPRSLFAELRKAHLSWVAAKRSLGRVYRRSIIRRRFRSFSYLARYLFESLSTSTK